MREAENQVAAFTPLAPWPDVTLEMVFWSESKTPSPARAPYSTATATNRTMKHTREITKLNFMTDQGSIRTTANCARRGVFAWLTLACPRPVFAGRGGRPRVRAVLVAVGPSSQPTDWPGALPTGPPGRILPGAALPGTPLPGRGLPGRALPGMLDPAPVCVLPRGAGPPDAVPPGNEPPGIGPPGGGAPGVVLPGKVPAPGAAAGRVSICTGSPASGIGIPRGVAVLNGGVVLNAAEGPSGADVSGGAGGRPPAGPAEAEDSGQYDPARPAP